MAVLNTNKYILLLFILAVANVLLYWPGNLYFLNDDFVHIPLTSEGVLFQQRSIRPIHELLVRFDLWLWHKKAFGFHLTALILHGIVTTQLFYLTKAIVVKYFNSNIAQATNTGLLACCLFLLYPQQAESLAWILGRTPTLAAIFFMGLMQLFVNGKSGFKTNIIAVILFLLTLFTYEQSILFPLVFALVAIVQKNAVVKKQQSYFAVNTAIAAAFYIVARKLITTEVVGAYEGGNFTFAHIQTLLANTLRIFLRLILNPSTIKIFYISAACFIIIVCALAWKFKTHFKSNYFWLFVFCTTILVAPIISLGVTIRSFESGRYLYFPSIFLVIALAIFVQQQNVLTAKIINVAFICLLVYWGFGKYQSANHFVNASAYSKKVHTQIQVHFTQTSTDTLQIDTLQLTIHRLPVFRMGFKAGVHWLNPAIDTSKIKVNYYYDEFIQGDK